jgi:hypothetical protein
MKEFGRTFTILVTLLLGSAGAAGAFFSFFNNDWIVTPPGLPFGAGETRCLTLNLDNQPRWIDSTIYSFDGNQIVWNAQWVNPGATLILTSNSPNASYCKSSPGKKVLNTFEFVDTGADLPLTAVGGSRTNKWFSTRGTVGVSPPVLIFGAEQTRCYGLNTHYKAKNIYTAIYDYNGNYLDGKVEMVDPWQTSILTVENPNASYCKVSPSLNVQGGFEVIDTDSTLPVLQLGLKYNF